MEISKETWDEILQSVKKEFDVSNVAFQTWLQPLEVHGVRDNTVIILVPTGQMGIDYISKKRVSNRNFETLLKPSYAERTFLPLALLAWRTFLPPFVLILLRKPWTFDLCLFLG